MDCKKKPKTPTNKPRQGQLSSNVKTAWDAAVLALASQHMRSYEVVRKHSSQAIDAGLDAITDALQVLAVEQGLVQVQPHRQLRSLVEVQGFGDTHARHDKAPQDSTCACPRKMQARAQQSSTS